MLQMNNSVKVTALTLVKILCVPNVNEYISKEVTSSHLVILVPQTDSKNLICHHKMWHLNSI